MTARFIRSRKENLKDEYRDELTVGLCVWILVGGLTLLSVVMWELGWYILIVPAALGVCRVTGWVVLRIFPNA